MVHLPSAQADRTVSVPSQPTSQPLKLAILRDFPQENWPSMDLAGEMLGRTLARQHQGSISTASLCPFFRFHAAKLPHLARSRFAWKADLAINRFINYPRYLRPLIELFDVFHVVDHSYAALVHALPAQRTGVYCHDLDAFRSILDRRDHKRPFWFRAMSRRVLQGMQKAAVVFYSTNFVRSQIEQHDLIEPSKLVHAPLGVADEFVPQDDDKPIEARTRQAAEQRFVLHVGSCADRKRIDVLLDVFAELRRSRRELRLVKVSGEWNESHRRQIDRHRLEDAIVHLQGLDRRELAWLYRRAAVVLFPSESEGFGLPVIEALACGAIVVASDIPVLHEVGDDALVYAPVGQIERWTQAAGTAIDEPPSAPSLERRLARAARFTWSNHARIIGQTYLKLM